MSALPQPNSDVSQKARRAARILDRLPTGVYENVTFVKGENGWEIRVPGVNNWVIAGDNVRPLWKETPET